MKYKLANAIKSVFFLHVPQLIHISPDPETKKYLILITLGTQISHAFYCLSSSVKVTVVSLSVQVIVEIWSLNV